MIRRIGRWSGLAMAGITWALCSGSASGAASADSSSPGAASAPASQALSLPAVGMVYDAAADFTKNWQAKQNPGGGWKYGWSEGLYGAFALFPQASILPYHNHQQEGWNDPAIDYVYTPSVRFNFGGDYDDGNVNYRAGAFILHGGGKGGRDYAHVIWTAPTGGRYAVSAIFYGQQHSVSADAHILINSGNEPHPDGPMFIRLSDAAVAPVSRISCFDATITENGKPGNYSGNLTLSAGDTIDFAVGLNGDFAPHAGCVGLGAVIQKL